MPALSIRLVLRYRLRERLGPVPSPLPVRAKLAATTAARIAQMPLAPVAGLYIARRHEFDPVLPRRRTGRQIHRTAS